MGVGVGVNGMSMSPQPRAQSGQDMQMYGGVGAGTGTGAGEASGEGEQDGLVREVLRVDVSVGADVGGVQDGEGHGAGVPPPSERSRPLDPKDEEAVAGYRKVSVVEDVVERGGGSVGVGEVIFGSVGLPEGMRSPSPMEEGGKVDSAGSGTGEEERSKAKMFTVGVRPGEAGPSSLLRERSKSRSGTGTWTATRTNSMTSDPAATRQNGVVVTGAGADAENIGSEVVDLTDKETKFEFGTTRTATTTTTNDFMDYSNAGVGVGPRSALPMENAPQGLGQPPPVPFNVGLLFSGTTAQAQSPTVQIGLESLEGTSPPQVLPPPPHTGPYLQMGEQVAGLPVRTSGTGVYVGQGQAPVPPPASTARSSGAVPSVSAAGSGTGDDLEVKDFGFGFGRASGTGYAVDLAREQRIRREKERERERERGEYQIQARERAESFGSAAGGVGAGAGVAAGIGAGMTQSVAPGPGAGINGWVPGAGGRSRRGSFAGNGYVAERGGYSGRRGRGMGPGGFGSGRGYGRGGGAYNRRQVQPQLQHTPPSRSPVGYTPPAPAFQSLPPLSSSLPPPLPPPPSHSISPSLQPPMTTESPGGTTYYALPQPPFIAPGFEAYHYSQFQPIVPQQPQMTYAPQPTSAPVSAGGAGMQPQPQGGMHPATVPQPITQLVFPLDPTRYYLLGQLEYYMSAQNMAGDYWLRKKVRCYCSFYFSR